MSENDNSVNIPNREGRYHHGDLRAALIEEGLAQLEAKAPDEVSLREIARNVGVSATAVYRHFPDKAALFKALCDVAGQRMAAAFREAMSGTTDTREAFNQMGRAYVKFALHNPSLFRVTMTQSVPQDRRGAPPGAVDDPFAMLSDTLDALMPPDAPRSARDVKRLQAWAMVHGLAMLMLDGQVPANEDLVDKVISATFL
ncbi:MAG: TetR/AcrR family transcriptional regulator [Hyphomonas sp.]|nr:TetR/AcrR family transcriptional regulator [Hyphomonas sp.]HRX74557.1 TetR/AcrR family transcriptional regulator [Hyphomonas sp.]